MKRNAFIKITNSFIKINIFDGTINIHGFNLNLEQMTDDDIKVTGEIDSIDFEKAN